MVKVCGKEINAAGKTVAELVETEGYRRDRVAVEINEEIVPKALYDTTVIKDGDCVEIVGFVGGG